jgi:hypothetical protein
MTHLIDVSRLAVRPRCGCKDVCITSVAVPAPVPFYSSGAGGRWTSGAGSWAVPEVVQTHHMGKRENESAQSCAVARVLENFGKSLNCKSGTDKAARHVGYRTAQPSAPTVPVGTCRHHELPVGTCRHRRWYPHCRQSTGIGNTPALSVSTIPASGDCRHQFGSFFGSRSAGKPEHGAIPTRPLEIGSVLLPVIISDPVGTTSVHYVRRGRYCQSLFKTGSVLHSVCIRYIQGTDAVTPMPHVDKLRIVLVKGAEKHQHQWDSC